MPLAIKKVANVEEKVLAFLEIDLPALWDHAQTELIIALFHDTTESALQPQTRARILQQHEDYFFQLLHNYRKWRRKSLEKQISDFLAHVPRLKLAKLDGGPRLESHLLDAYLDFRNLKESLNKKLQGANFRGKRSPLIREAIVENLDPDLTLPIPHEQLEEWSRQSSITEIARNIAAWANEVKPSSLKRWGPKKAKTSRAFLPWQSHAVWLANKSKLPVAQEIVDKLTAQQRRILPTYRSSYLIPKG